MSILKIDYTRPTASPRAGALRIAALIALIAYLCLLVYLSLVPTVPSAADVSDKALHFLAYGGLTVLAAAAFPRLHLITLFIAASLIGAFLEIGQGISNMGRMASFEDQIANMGGALLALSIWAALTWLKAKLFKTA